MLFVTHLFDCSDRPGKLSLTAYHNGSRSLRSHTVHWLRLTEVAILDCVCKFAHFRKFECQRGKCDICKKIQVILNKVYLLLLINNVFMSL